MRSPIKLSLGASEGKTFAFFECKPFWSKQDLNSNTALPRTVGEIVKTSEGAKILAIEEGTLLWLDGVHEHANVLSSVSIRHRLMESGEAAAAMDRILFTNGSVMLKQQQYFLKIVPLPNESFSEILMFDQLHQYENWRRQLAKVPVLFKDLKSRVESISEIGKDGNTRLYVGHVPSNKSMVLTRSYTGKNALEEAKQEKRVLERLEKHKHFPKYLEIQEVSAEEVVLVKEYVGGITLSRWMKEFLPIEVKGPNDVVSLLRMMNELFQLVSILHEEELAHGALTPDSILVCPLVPVSMENLDSLDFLRKHSTRRVSLLHYSKISDLSKSKADPPEASIINALKFSQYKARATEDLYSVAKIFQTIVFGQDPNQVRDQSSLVEDVSEEDKVSPINRALPQGMVKNGRVHLYNLEPDIFTMLDDIIYAKPKKRPQPRECVFRIQRSLQMEVIKARTHLLKKATLNGYQTSAGVSRKPSMNLNPFAIGRQSGISIEAGTTELDELKSFKNPGGLDSSLGYGNSESLISLRSLRSMKLNRIDRASSFAKKPVKVLEADTLCIPNSKAFKLSNSREPNSSPQHRTLRDLRLRYEKIDVLALLPYASQIKPSYTTTKLPSCTPNTLASLTEY